MVPQPLAAPLTCIPTTTSSPSFTGISLIDGLLAIFLIFIAIVAFNIVVDMEIPSLSEDSSEFKTSQDVMELMSMDVDGKDYSILEKISYTLSKSKY